MWETDDYRSVERGLVAPVRVFKNRAGEPKGEPGMNPTLDTDRRQEAMADVPGVCELPLTRAVVQYRDAHEIDADGGRIQDIGLALALSANVRETRSTQRIRVGRRQRKRTCWDCEREWKRMVVPLEPGRPSEARQLLRTRR